MPNDVDVAAAVGPVTEIIVEEHPFSGVDGTLIFVDTESGMRVFSGTIEPVDYVGGDKQVDVLILIIFGCYHVGVRVVVITMIMMAIVMKILTG